MLSRVNTWLLKLASVATSKEYVSGRTPDVDAFSISSVTGCLSTAILTPLTGSSISGAEMFTPGIGPAIVGASGSELLFATQALAAKVRTIRLDVDKVLRIIEITR